MTQNTKLPATVSANAESTPSLPPPITHEAPFAVLQFQMTDRPAILRDLLIEKGIVLRDMDNGFPVVAPEGTRTVSRYAYNKITDGKPLWLLEVGDIGLDGELVFRSWIINRAPTDELIEMILTRYPPQLYQTIEASTFTHGRKYTMLPDQAALTHKDREEGQGRLS